MVRSLSGRFMEGYERKPVVNLTHGDFDLGDIAHESARGCLRNGTVRLPGEDGDGAECLVRVVSKRRQRHSCDWLVRQKAALLEFGHPFLLRLLGTFQDQRNLFGIFEPCAGGELFSWLRKGEVPWAVASFYGAEVAAALDHVHLCKLRERSRGTVGGRCSPRRRPRGSGSAARTGTAWSTSPRRRPGRRAARRRRGRCGRRGRSAS